MCLAGLAADSRARGNVSALNFNSGESGSNAYAPFEGRLSKACKRPIDPHALGICFQHKVGTGTASIEEKQFGPQASGMTYRLLDPPYVAVELSLTAFLLLLPRLGQLATRREEKEDSLDWLWDEIQELRVEREQVLEGEWT